MNRLLRYRCAFYDVAITVCLLIFFFSLLFSEGPTGVSSLFAAGSVALIWHIDEGCWRAPDE